MKEVIGNSVIERLLGTGASTGCIQCQSDLRLIPAALAQTEESGAAT